MERARRLRRKHFEALSDKDKEEYLAKYPKSVHRKEHDAKKVAENPKLPRHKLPGTDLVVRPIHTNPSTRESRALRVAEHSAVEQQIRTINADGSAVINRHSIKAVARVGPKHLKEASKALDDSERRGEIIEGVAERVKEHPKLFNRGFNALGKVFQGAKKLSPKDMRSAKRVLTQVAMIGLLGVGVMSLAMGAAPLAVVTSRMLFDIWMGHQANKKADEREVKRLADKSKDTKALPAPKKSKGQKKIEAPAESDQISAEDFAKGKTGSKRKSRKTKVARTKSNVKALPASKKGGTLPAQKAKALPSPKKKWSDEDAEDAEFAAASADDFALDPEHEETIHIILDQLSDLLKYQSADDIKSLSGKMFAGASSDESDMYRELFDAVSKLALGRLNGQPGKSLFGAFRVGITELLEIVERVTQVAPEPETEDGRTVYHFAGQRGLVTVGVLSDDDIYFRVTGV